MRVLLAVLLAVSAPAVKHDAAGMVLAKASVLAAGDLGKGWSGTPSPQGGIALACRGFDPSGAGIVETGAAASPTFSFGPTGPFLLQKTSVYATLAQANAYWRRAVTAKLLACAVQTLQAVSSRGVKVTITKQAALPFTTSAAHTRAFRVAGALTSNGNTVTNYLDVIVLGNGRAITAITISSFKSPPPAQFEQIVAHQVVTKLGGPSA
jgi:hypothetical protein